MSLIARATTPTKTGVTAAQVAKDITVYGGPLVALLSTLAGAGAVSIPGSWLGVLDAIIPLLTAISSIKSQQAVAQAAAK